MPADYVVEEEPSVHEAQHDMDEAGTPVYQQKRQPQEEEEDEKEEGKGAGEENHAPAETSVVVALYDFDAGRADELSFQEGDHIHVIDREDDAWWRGKTCMKCIMVWKLNFII